jgi:multidrug efflux pump
VIDTVAEVLAIVEEARSRVPAGIEVIVSQNQSEFAAVQVMLGLPLLAKPFSALLTGVGVVALAGIVVNNNIILIDTFNHVRRSHPELDVRRVIVRATAQRLRPVLLTTVTTVFGLLPLACGFSVDLISRTVMVEGEMAMFWAPLSQAIVFGLAFATILTLIATPAMLAFPVAVREWWSRFQPRDPSSNGVCPAALAD